MIEIQDISVSFGNAPVLNSVSFALQESEVVGLVGPSGGGKSVLLKVLGNVIKPDAGIVRSSSGSHPSVGFLFQEGALFDSMSVIENVAFPLFSLEEGRPSREEGFERAYQILARVGLRQAIHKQSGQLSGGMRRRVGIARALVSNPEVVLLDDPTGGLDPVAASVIMELILTLHKEYRPTVVLVSHDIRRLLPSVERVLALFEGEIICDTAPGDLLECAPERVISFLRTRFDFESLPLESST